MAVRFQEVAQRVATANSPFSMSSGDFRMIRSAIKRHGLGLLITAGSSVMTVFTFEKPKNRDSPHRAGQRPRARRRHAGTPEFSRYARYTSLLARDFLMRFLKYPPMHQGEKR
jgi:hypothetical protein